MNVVHCPTCGTAVVMPLGVESVTKFPSQLAVVMRDITVMHTCPKPPQDAS